MSVHPFKTPHTADSADIKKLAGEPEPPVFLTVVDSAPATEKPTLAASLPISGPFVFALGAMLCLAAFVASFAAAGYSSFALPLLAIGGGMLTLSCVTSLLRLPVSSFFRLPLDVLGIFTLSAGIGAFYGTPLGDVTFTLLTLGVLWFAVPAAEWVTKGLLNPVFKIFGGLRIVPDVLLSALGVWLLYTGLHMAELL